MCVHSHCHCTWDQRTGAHCLKTAGVKRPQYSPSSAPLLRPLARPAALLLPAGRDGQRSRPHHKIIPPETLAMLIPCNIWPVAGGSILSCACRHSKPTADSRRIRSVHTIRLRDARRTHGAHRHMLNTGVVHGLVSTLTPPCLLLTKVSIAAIRIRKAACPRMRYFDHELCST